MVSLINYLQEHSMKQIQDQSTDLPPITQDQSTDLPLIKGDEAKAIGDEYEALIQKESTTEQENERVAKILELAIYHPDVEFWVSNATTRVAKIANLLTDTKKEEFRDQKALLREHIGNPALPPIRGRAALPPVSQEKITQQVQEQIELQRMTTVLEKANIVQPASQSKTHNQRDGNP
jgi:hypothetical protein